MAHENNYETAVCFFPNNERIPLKYRNIKSRGNFERFIKTKWPAVQYINWYNKATKVFQGRTYFQQ